MRGMKVRVRVRVRVGVRARARARVRVRVRARARARVRVRVRARVRCAGGSPAARAIPPPRAHAWVPSCTRALGGGRGRVEQPHRPIEGADLPEGLVGRRVDHVVDEHAHLGMRVRRVRARVRARVRVRGRVRSPCTRVTQQCFGRCTGRLLNS